MGTIIKELLMRGLIFRKRKSSSQKLSLPYLAALSHNIANILPGDLNVSYLPNSEQKLMKEQLN